MRNLQYAPALSVMLEKYMNTPPAEIDGARVLEWAWSGDKPFGVIPCGATEPPIEIFGLAICQYPASEKVYRFSCNSNWEVEQDSDYESSIEAKANLPRQYQEVKAVWESYKAI